MTAKIYKERTYSDFNATYRKSRNDYQYVYFFFNEKGEKQQKVFYGKTEDECKGKVLSFQAALKSGVAITAKKGYTEILSVLDICKQYMQSQVIGKKHKLPQNHMPARFACISSHISETFPTPNYPCPM